MRLLTASLLALAALTACGNDDKADGGPQLFVETVEVNGREVSCVVYDSARDAGAVDCDFEGER